MSHKPGNSIRPILSQIPTATYPIAKKLNELLTPYVPSTYTLSSASDFLEILRDFPPLPHCFVRYRKSLHKTIDFILKQVYHSNETKPLDIPEKTLKELLEICTEEAPFTSPSGQTYKQIDGVAMSSPLGVLFPSFYMGTIETNVLKAARPFIYCRYVDDIFVQIKDPDEQQDIRR
ncbi:uncharacterized protein LOC143025907 [Oratosquilla oratoria]|uniref:uncharacterized protein LOC143025907 n=1 Tax=Oratosquilla oratoria TaxID=337810 RepID=UPI003F774D92